MASVGTGSDAIAIVSSHPDAQFIGEPEDDARLIAAAPDLLEALQAIADSWPAHGSGAQNAMADAMAAKARAALSRATGSEQ